MIGEAIIAGKANYRLILKKTNVSIDLNDKKTYHVAQGPAGS